MTYENQTILMPNTGAACEIVSTYCSCRYGFPYPAPEAALDFSHSNSVFCHLIYIAVQAAVLMLPRSRHAISTSAAIVLLAVAAVLACLWLTNPATRHVVPIAFAVAVVLVAVRYGATAGILGSLVVAAVFVFLYSPGGSFRVHDAVARDRIGWMLLAGISLSYLLAAPGFSNRDHKR